MTSSRNRIDAVPIAAGHVGVAIHTKPIPRVSLQRLLVPVASLRALIVDDNIDAAAMLGDLLQASGHEVTVAHDGASSTFS